MSDTDPMIQYPFSSPYVGYGPEGVPVELVGRYKGRTKCDLHIPHKTAGKDLAEILEKLEGIKPEESARIGEALARLDENWKALEEWQHHFFRYCICHCQQSNPE